MKFWKGIKEYFFRESYTLSWNFIKVLFCVFSVKKEKIMRNQLLYGGILLLATACSSPKNFSVEDGNTFIVIDEKASVPAVLAAHEL